MPLYKMHPLERRATARRSQADEANSVGMEQSAGSVLGRYILTSFQQRERISY